MMRQVSFSAVGSWIRRKKLEPLLAMLLFIAALLLCLKAVSYNVITDALFGDALAYWKAGQGIVPPYSLPPNTPDAFLYSPAFLQAISPITWLPWNIFAALWFLLCLAAYIWLLKPLGWMWGGVALLFCVGELVRGNIIAFLAVAIVLGLQGKPAAWAFPVLTKPVFGVGLLWFAVRKEWRPFSIALLMTGSIVALSFLWNPQAWEEWVLFLLDNSGNAPAFYPLRVIIAVIIIAVAARKDKAWFIPIALLLCTPVIGGYPVFMILTAIPRLVKKPQSKSELPPVELT